MTISQIISEKWLPVVGYEGLYEVSDRGRVYSVPRVIDSHNPGYKNGKQLICGRIFKPGSHLQGYLVVGLSKNGKPHTFPVHKLVLEAFIGPRPPGMECCHQDGDPKNNYLKNIKWGSYSENRSDMIRHGRSTRGEKQPTSKLTELDVYCIRDWLRDGRWSQVIIADCFGVHSSSISAIKHGKNWGWLKPLQKGQ